MEMSPWREPNSERFPATSTLNLKAVCTKTLDGDSLTENLNKDGKKTGFGNQKGGQDDDFGSK